MHRMLREEQQEFKSLIGTRGHIDNLAIVLKRTIYPDGGRRK